VEFGLCKEPAGLRIYGAGIMGSSKEIKYALSDVPKKYPLDLFEIAQNHMHNEITDLQPYYFVADSFENAKIQVTEYIDAMYKPFNVSFNERDSSIVIDRCIKTREATR
jgi:phenylalanine-4-hydroxylase